VADGAYGLQILELERPAFTQATMAGGMLHLSWNDAATGAVLQRSSNLNNAVWVDVPGSEMTNRVTRLLGSGNEFFRLVKQP